MNPEVHIPGWEWYYVAMYFFIAGISAGAYFIGSLAEMFGGERHREISRTGYYIAFPLILLTPPLLIADLRKAADARLAQLKGLGHGEANIYGYKEAGGLNVFYLFLDRPQVYGQTESVVVPQRRLPVSSAVAIAGALALGGAALVSFRERGSRPEDGEEVKT